MMANANSPVTGFRPNHIQWGEIPFRLAALIPPITEYTHKAIITSDTGIITMSIVFIFRVSHYKGVVRARQDQKHNGTIQPAAAEMV
jgi:hypothetical protein